MESRVEKREGPGQTFEERSNCHEGTNSTYTGRKVSWSRGKITILKLVLHIYFEYIPGRNIALK